MTTPRRPLKTISSNRQFNSYLSLYKRGRIAKKAATSQNAATIATDLKLAISTIKYTIQQDKLRNDSHTLPKKPRRKTYTPYQERLLVCHVRLHLKDTYAKVIIACNLNYKTFTIKTILKKYGIANQRAKKSLKLIEAYAIARLAQCFIRRYQIAEEQGLVMWSDECSVRQGRGKRLKQVFRMLA